MSYMDELRERFLAAEQRFGRINEAGREYRDRLMGLMSRVEEEIRCRRDMEQQQAKEIERLSGEIDRISGENEQLRTMMMSLLTAVEAGDSDSLGGTLNEMDTKVATLIGEGQGAVAPEPMAAADEPAEPVSDTSEFADELADELSEEEPFSAPSFPAGDMMPLPGDEPPFSGGDADLDHDEASGSEEMVAETPDFAEETMEDDSPIAAEADSGAEDEVPESIEPMDAGAAMDAGSDREVASEMSDFYGVEGGSGDAGDAGDAVPAYSHAVAGWEDFLDDDGAASDATTATDEGGETLSEVSADYAAEDVGDPEAGSIHDLIDRVKTEVDGEDIQAEHGADETVSLDSDDDDDKAAAQ